ncbi:PREDICTED: protein PLASTID TRANSCRIPTIONALLY ACTIVE 12 isoform X2 [Camelina sativa]|uniref:Protein PLASTID TRANSCRIPTIONALLY ACTIVE 12 isoform X2 n=1 Tax=Camelina sativa TaxID=90675 RepID=A0ABM0YRQ5_CAMSA|nr:PREDICTED: protein PLASTID TRANSCRIPTIONALLY ACTIVE 12 isoform X2 [Camelina sativa]
MASISTTSWLYGESGKFSNCILQRRVSKCGFPMKTLHVGITFGDRSLRHCIKCKKEDEDEGDDASEDTKKIKEGFEYVTVERHPYYSYMDSTSGKLEPASGARASIPGEDYWPEGTSSRVRAARAPQPAGESSSFPSYGKNPGSRRKKNRKATEDNVTVVETSDEVSDSEDSSEEEENDSSDGFVVYDNESGRKEDETGFELDKKLGRPHPFIDPTKKKEIEKTLTGDESWWNWRKPEKEQWSRWQRRRPDVETVFLKAMAETGQVKLYGKEPTLTETSLYRARRHLFKEERLQAERERLAKEGPMAFYSEWVKAWKRDTSREAVQKHFEETGEDENTQLIEMFSHQTDREYRIMMGADIRIKRDPLAMRMREDQIKQIWGGDPVYPTINYIQDPNAVMDFRGPDFHEPTPNMLSYLKENGKVISREMHEALLTKEKTEQLEVPDIDDAMAQAVDIGENDDEEDDADVEKVDEKVPRNWSVLKSTPELRTAKPKPKKEGRMSLDEAVDDSENLTDFLMDFEEEADP